MDDDDESCEDSSGPNNCSNIATPEKGKEADPYPGETSLKSKAKNDRTIQIRHGKLRQHCPMTRGGNSIQQRIGHDGHIF